MTSEAALGPNKLQDPESRKWFDTTISIRTAAQLKLASILSPQNNEHQLTFAVNSCRSALDLLQIDAVNEFLDALPVDPKTPDLLPGLYSIKDGMASLSSILPVNLHLQFNEREVVFLLVSQLFNRTDEIVEQTLARKGKLERDDLLESVLTKGVICKVGQVEVTPLELFEHIKMVAEKWGLNTSDWDERLQTIITAQRKGMLLVNNSRERGQITYTVGEALDYRRNTIGNYAKLLADIAYQDEPSQKRFIRRMMEIQRKDDEQDIYYDRNTQVNPYVALLNEFGLLDSYNSSFAVRLMVTASHYTNYMFAPSLLPFLLLHGKPTHNEKDFRTEIDKLRTGYLKL